MKIAKDCAVTVRMRMLVVDGHPGPAGGDTMAYLHGGYGNLFASLEAALEGQEAGYAATLSFSAEDAFGSQDPALAITIPKSEFPAGIKVGGQLERGGQYYRVLKIKGAQVMLDANHPLAGKALKLAITVVAVRAASADEIAHGHVHDANGYQH